MTDAAVAVNACIYYILIWHNLNPMAVYHPEERLQICCTIHYSDTINYLVGRLASSYHNIFYYRQIV